MLVPFGRYKGKPIEQMLADKPYVAQQLQSEAIAELYPEFVAALRSRLGVNDVPAEVPCVTESAPLTPDKKTALPPTTYQMRCAYRWLTSIDMFVRINGDRITPPGRCRFLIDWLASTKREELSTHDGLSWRDWNACYAAIGRLVPEDMRE